MVVQDVQKAQETLKEALSLWDYLQQVRLMSRDEEIWRFCEYAIMGQYLFDFGTFAKLINKCDISGQYSRDEVFYVFWLYFVRYEYELSVPHPNISAKQICNISAKMPSFESEPGKRIFTDIPPFVYLYIIGQHFKTRYRSCDYNINHFFSGRIRELRYYEVMR